MATQSHDRAVLAAFTAAKIEFSEALSRARLQAGKPSYREMSRRGFSYSPATITRVLRGETLPKWAFVDEFLKVCDVNGPEIEQVWRPRWVRIAELARTATSVPTSPNGAEKHDASTECPICGASVINTDRHTEWHSTLAARPHRPATGSCGK